MARNSIGFVLSTLNRLAGNPWLDRLGMRKPSERMVYTGTRMGFQALATAGREFQRARHLFPRKRLTSPSKPVLFDLSLDDDQIMITEMLRRFADEVIRSQAANCDETASLNPTLESAAEELGLTLYAVPTEFGGVAEHRSPVTSTLIAENLARGDMGIALALLAPFSVAQAITRWGTAAQQNRYLPAFCDDPPPKATIAIDEPTALFDPTCLATRASHQNTTYVINGIKNAVINAHESDLFLVAAVVEGQGPQLFLIERGTPGLSVIEDPAMGLRPCAMAQLKLDNVQVDANALLGDDDFSYQALLDHATILRNALAIGTAQAVLDYVIPYCNEREAFGEPISHRQSVAFMISDMAIELESMRLLNWRAASRAESGETFHREACLAGLLCSEKAMTIGASGVQLLGGHGFVKEHPVERWYRDLRATATQFGGTHA